MASGSQLMTTYYAKRIIGDSAANTPSTALLQSGVQNSMWIFGHARNNYGIKYLYDNSTNGTADKIEFHGDNATAWVQLDTGDTTILGTLTITNSGTTGTLTATEYSGNAATATIAEKVIHPDASVSYISGAKGISAAVYAKKAYNENHWYPAVTLDTKGGGSWQMGNYNDETLEFCYATKANRDSDTNTVTEIYMNAGDTGRIATSGNVETGDSNGQIKIAGTNVSVKGLKSAAYTESTDYATSGHTHTLTIATDSGTNALTLAANTKYKLTAGDSTFIFTTPAHQDISGKANLSGATFTGNISLKVASIDASKTNNNISSTQYPTTFNILDSAERIMCRIEGVIQSNGAIRSYWYVRNYDTSGTLTAQKGIWMEVANDGTMTYNVADGAKFRSAIGAGTSSLTIGTSSTTAAAGDHNHDSTYLKLSGGTITGWLYIKNDDDAPRIHFGSNDSTGADGGFIYMGMAQTNNIYRPNKYNFRIFSYNSSTGATDSSHFETYSLPQVTPDMTNTKTYNILTDKDLSFSITGNATTATKATQDGDGNNIVSRYLPYIANAGLGEVAGGGQNNYFLLATLTVTGGYQNSPVVFEVSRRGYGFQRLQVMFVSTSSYDPDLGSFVTDGNTTLFWIKKSATSTWQIYGQYNEVWGACALHRITGRATNNGVNVTVNLTNAGTTAPGGTEVTRFWSAAYADSAGTANNVAWANTNHPSTFAPSAHNHGAGDINSGTLGVARGGTGASSFTANCAIVSGSSTTAALTTRGIYARSSVGTLDWGTYSNYLVTNSCLAYWNGAYSGTSSNLQYCDRGRFGTIVTKGSGDYVSLSTPTASNQLMHLIGTTGTHNADSSAYDNHQLIVVLTKTGITLYDNTAKANVWNTSQMVQGVLSINTSSGSTSKCLTEKGTWVSFTNNAGTVTQVKINGSAKNPSSGVVDLGSGYLTSHQSLDACVKTTGNWSLSGVISLTKGDNASNTTSGTLKVTGGIGASGNIYGSKVFGAVWNDYAEYREVETEEPGYCVTETKDRRMIKTQKRLQPGCKVTSDTFGICMGQTKAAKTPIAVAGRVLVYPYRNSIHYQLGDAVCSAPGGTVDLMTRDEIMMYPERIVGTVSEIPDYEVWHSDVDGKEEIQVNGRIWIYVR